jgi:hypothetical protein
MLIIPSYSTKYELCKIFDALCNDFGMCEYNFITYKSDDVYVRKKLVLESLFRYWLSFNLHTSKKYFMNDIKTFFAFRDGEIIQPVNDDCDLLTATTVERIKCFLSPLIEKHKLSGQVFVETKDGIHFVDYDVTPKQYEQQLKQELNKNSFVFERAEFKEEKIKEHTQIM